MMNNIFKGFFSLLLALFILVGLSINVTMVSANTDSFTLTIGDYTTTISRDSNAVLTADYYDTDQWGKGEITETTYYADGKITLRGAKKYNSDRWFHYEIILIDSNFDSDNPVLDHSLIDNILLESPDAYNYVKNRLYNSPSTVGHINFNNDTFTVVIPNIQRIDDNSAIKEMPINNPKTNDNYIYFIMIIVAISMVAFTYFTHKK